MAVETKPKIYTFSMWENLNSNVCLVLALFSKQKCTSMKFLCKRVSHKNLSTFFFLLYGVSYCCTEEASQSFKSACWESETFLHLCQFILNDRWSCDKNVQITKPTNSKLALWEIVVSVGGISQPAQWVSKRNGWRKEKAERWWPCTENTVVVVFSLLN